MPDVALVYSVPGGTVGLNPLPAGEPFDVIGRTVSAFPTANRFSLNAGAGGNMTNGVDAVNGRSGWRCFSALAGVGGCLSQVQYGAGGFCKMPSIASILSGAVSGTLATRFGHYYAQIDARLAIQVGDGFEMAFVFSPSFVPLIGNTFGFSQGFGLAWANTLASANYRLVMVDATGVVFNNQNTGISATDGAVKMLRIEWGWIDNAPRIRAIIDGVAVAEVTGPITLSTVARLAMFTNPAMAFTAKLQNGNNQIEAFVGTVNGFEMGIIE